MANKTDISKLLKKQEKLMIELAIVTEQIESYYLDNEDEDELQDDYNEFP